MRRGWDDLIEAHYNDEGRHAMERVREVMEPLGARFAFIEDNKPFGAPVCLIARGPEGELFGFRATVVGAGQRMLKRMGSGAGDWRRPGHPSLSDGVPSAARVC
ncbi:MAG: hypothetical protein ABIJ09_13310 [Pseudomonadota bacterium]